MGVHKPNNELTWISINSQPLFRPSETALAGVVASFHRYYSPQKDRGRAGRSPAGDPRTEADLASHVWRDGGRSCMILASGVNPCECAWIRASYAQPEIDLSMNR